MGCWMLIAKSFPKVVGARGKSRVSAEMEAPRAPYRKIYVECNAYESTYQQAGYVWKGGGCGWVNGHFKTEGIRNRPLKVLIKNYSYLHQKFKNLNSNFIRMN